MAHFDFFRDESGFGSCSEREPRGIKCLSPRIPGPAYIYTPIYLGNPGPFSYGNVKSLIPSSSLFVLAVSEFPHLFIYVNQLV